ncbi:MAG: chromosome segregation SMC family protein, partial [Thermodesulfobacteriota bacterium]
MRIKSLQLVGFKSFYDKTSIQCHSGINAIVGPNGCGKSNILDAIRWILGEQNPRRLRAEGMDEVISNGSEVLKPLGMAEVSMIITDVTKHDFEEVEIKRRLFRSGESEFYINGMPCRLKDISEMFLDTGVGARAYSVIAQGRVEQLITSKPEEKRMLIEEVAGIIKYKVRRRETESRIKSTNENIARVKDVIKEVKHQMQVLSRQAKDAEKFTNISKEVRRTEVGINRFKIFELDMKRKKILEDKSEIDERISSAHDLIKGKDELLNDLDERIKPLGQKLEELEKEIIEIRSNQQSKESFHQRVLSEISGIDDYVGKLEREIVLLNEEKGRIGDQFEIKKSNLEEVKAEKTSKQSELIKKEESLSNLKNRLTQERSELQSSRPALFETLDKYSSQKGIVFGFEKELDELKSRRDRTIKEMREVEGERENTFKFISELEQGRGQLEEQKYQIKNDNEGIQLTFSSLSEDQEVKKKESIKLKERQNEVFSRLDVLKQVQSNYEWLPEGIRKFLVERKGNGILGLTADFISVQKGYEKAIEAALGERLKWIFVKESEEAITAVESLRELAVGRGTFVPI